MTTTETWLPVVGFDQYEVSDNGRVRSTDRTIIRKNGVRTRLKGRILQASPNFDGYLRVELCRHGKGKTIAVHILVCSAFHGVKPEWADEVRHCNGNQTDNSADNLRWSTHTENVHDIIRHGNNYYLNRTHCPQGHEYNAENTRYERSHRDSSRKRRRCRQCNRDKSARQYAAAKRAKTARRSA